MKPDPQLQLQAYLDGELTEAEVRSVEDSLLNDARARELLEELRLTRSLLSGQDLIQPVPESREFYWSKIARQIERESTIQDRPVLRVPSYRRWFATLFSPVGAVLAMLVAVLAGSWFFVERPTNTASQAPEIELDFAGANMLTFQDQEERMTVVWLTFND